VSPVFLGRLPIDFGHIRFVAIATAVVRTQQKTRRSTYGHTLTFAMQIASGNGCIIIVINMMPRLPTRTLT
jgi:cytochrome c biogenesis protein CcdA